MKYKAIFFDLDGTLTNPEKGILNCIQYACDYYGVKTEWDSLKKYIGPPLKDTFTELLGAEKMNMDAVGVLYGFGDFDELSACKNVCLINDITELCDILITK